MRPVSSAALRGFLKLARMSPSELRDRFAQHGTFHGGVRGAALGAALGAGLGLAEGESDPAEIAKRMALGGVGLGGLGALRGHLRGKSISHDPYRTEQDSEGAVRTFLRLPGEFSDELMHAKYPIQHSDVRLRRSLPAEHWLHQEHPDLLTYSPTRGSALLDDLRQHGHLPDEVARRLGR